MCRLFGFKSVIPSQVHHSLISADNALIEQSNRHPDGWGVAYYIDGSPQVTRSPETAFDDHLFQRLSGVVSSQTVLAHVRKATIGRKTVFNCHPFQHGRWVLAHNGEIENFPRCRDALLGEVAPALRRFILGETDSEVIFFMVLSQLASKEPLTNRRSAEDAAAAVTATIKRVREICDGGDDIKEPAKLTLILTDGNTMVATQSGRELYWSTYKTRCADRDTCPHLAPECEAPTKTGSVNHMILSSEPLGGDNVWHEMKRDDVIGTDWDMKLFFSSEGKRALPVIG